MSSLLFCKNIAEIYLNNYSDKFTEIMSWHFLEMTVESIFSDSCQSRCLSRRFDGLASSG